MIDVSVVELGADNASLRVANITDVGVDDLDVQSADEVVADSRPRGVRFRLTSHSHQPHALVCSGGAKLYCLYFNNRVVNAWNSLPDHAVLSETNNTSKSRLDKFWQHQDVIYDFQAELHGTGSRSLHSN